MGIRVFCPNGHRLNLKSHLAGKQGVCPHCGMTVAIPSLEKAEELGMLKNPRLAGREKALGGGYGAANGAVALASVEGPTGKAASEGASCEPSLASPYARANGSSSTNSSSSTNGSSSPRYEDRSGSSLDDGGIDITARNGSADNPSRRSSSSAEVAAPTAAPVEQEADPIAENPQAVWYVRTPQGGQYGPAAGDIMRKWIAEGRVQADFWVWREGWADWQKANSAIPSLKHAASAATAAPIAAPTAPAAARLEASPRVAASTASPKTLEPGSYAGGESSAATRPARPRRRGIHPLAILAVAGLGLVCLALTGVLIAILADVL